MEKMAAKAWRAQDHVRAVQSVESSGSARDGLAPGCRNAQGQGQVGKG